MPACQEGITTARAGGDAIRKPEIAREVRRAPNRSHFQITQRKIIIDFRLSIMG